ncbi:MAG TPA: hypothetical protein VJG64_04150 [Candidatus Paceibacterota bacterium]
MTLVLFDRTAVAALGDAANALRELNRQNPNVDYGSIARCAHIASSIIGKEQAVFVREHGMGGAGDCDVLIGGWKKVCNPLGTAKLDHIYGELWGWIRAMQTFSRRPKKLRIDRDAPRRERAAEICIAMRMELLEVLPRQSQDSEAAS